jgi:hypothetical protein
VYFENAEKWRTTTGLRHLQIHLSTFLTLTAVLRSPLHYTFFDTSPLLATRDTQAHHSPTSATNTAQHIKQSCVLLLIRQWTQCTNYIICNNNIKILLLLQSIWWKTFLV